MIWQGYKGPRGDGYDVEQPSRASQQLRLSQTPCATRRSRLTHCQGISRSVCASRYIFPADRLFFFLSLRTAEHRICFTTTQFLTEIPSAAVACNCLIAMWVAAHHFLLLPHCGWNCPLPRPKGKSWKGHAEAGGGGALPAVSYPGAQTGLSTAVPGTWTSVTTFRAELSSMPPPPHPKDKALDSRRVHLDLNKAPALASMANSPPSLPNTNSSAKNLSQA